MVNGLPDATRVVFDDERAVANAGVLLPAVLADRLGIEALVDQTVDLGDRSGAAILKASSPEKRYLPRYSVPDKATCRAKLRGFRRGSFYRD